MTDIFTPVDVTNDEQEISVDTLVGDGKKFADINALAKAKIEADRYIARLEAEAAEMRQEVTKKLTLDEIMTQIKSAQPPVHPSTPQEPRTPVADTPDIETVVQSAIEKKEAEARKKRNLDLVSSKLEEKYGQDANLNINKKAKELGMNVSDLQKIATENPAVFFKLMDFDRTPVSAPTPAPRSGMNLPPATGGVRDSAYYEKMRRQNPEQFRTPETILQRYKDQFAAIKAGKAW